MITVLMICVHNSARSQAAESSLMKLGGDRLVVESAGLEPGRLNPQVVCALQEDGIDISGKATHGTPT
jgi:arsenate reductase